MRKDLLKAIAKGGDVANAIVLTHDIDFMFFQSLVLPALRRRGHPSITILADSRCALATYPRQREYLSGLGTNYRVVPVAMPQPHFRFHPKAILLSGPNGGELFVGSGNLTFGGWRGNAEVWARFSSAEGGTGPFLAFRDYLLGVLGHISVPGPVEDEVRSALNENTWDWLTGDADSQLSILGRPGSSEGLLRQMLALAGTGYGKVYVCAPFFDAEAKALAQLIKNTAPAEVQVLCQPSGTTLTKEAWSRVAGKARLRAAGFRQSATGKRRRSPYLHSKFYAFERQYEVVVFLGSANCSQAGLTLEGNIGNAELMAVQRMSPAEFKEFLNEMEFQDEVPELDEAAQPVVAEEQEASSGLQILAARYEHGNLTIGYNPASVKVQTCLLEGIPTEFSEIGAGTLNVPCALRHGMGCDLVLVAKINGATVEARPGWIDFESELRLASQKGRLIDSIHSNLKDGALLPEGFGSILELLCQQLEQTPVPATRGSARASSSTELQTPIFFTREDVFTEGYGYPRLGRPSVRFNAHRYDVVAQFLTHLLGGGSERMDEGPDVAGAALESPRGDDATEGSEVVDRPTEIQLEPVTEALRLEPTARELNRIEKRVLRVGEVISKGKYLADAPPGQLAVGIQVVAALLMAGLHRGWIKQPTFFQVTQNIWSALFFSRSKEEDVGWLEYRIQASEEPEAFVKELRSPQLAAALIGWALATPIFHDPPGAARLTLACAAASARLPDLWGGDEDWNILVGEELTALLHTLQQAQDATQVGRFQEELQRLIQLGSALRQFEEALRPHTLDDLLEQLPKAHPGRGELIWQGKLGYFVVLRKRREGVAALALQGDGKNFAEGYAATVASLLELDEVTNSAALSDEALTVLQELIASLRTAFGSYSED